MNKLMELCLNKIVTSFERFHYAYSTSDNHDLQRGLFFLQKVYTFELASRIGCRLQEKYADFIFNEHLKCLETLWFTKFSWKTIFQTFKKIGSNLESVVFNHENYILPWKDIVCYIRNVKTVIYKNNSSSEFLMYIANYCSRLETLDVTSSENVTDTGVEYFCIKRSRKREDLTQKENGFVPCALLKEIYLFMTSVTHKGIQRLLKNLPSLEKIKYPTLPIVLYEMHKDNLDSLHKVDKYNLRHLNILCGTDLSATNLPAYDEMLKICLALCPSLKTLHYSVFKSEHLNLCSALPDLEDLSVEGNRSVDVSDFLKWKGANLIRLMIRGCTISLSVLGQCCRHLKELILHCVTIQYNEYDFIPIFYNLKQFNFSPNLSDSSNCRAISRILTSSAALEKLSVYDTLPSEIKIAILKCCEQHTLKSIDFFCDVEMEFLENVRLTCHTLENLNYPLLAHFQKLYVLATVALNRIESGML